MSPRSMMDLVRGMGGHPAQRSLLVFRIDCRRPCAPIPVGIEAGQDIGEQPGCVLQLTCHIVTPLFGIAVVRHSFVAAHRVERRIIHPTGGQHPLPLDEQDVTDMAAVQPERPEGRF